MDSIERRNSKINPKQLLFNLSLLHVWKKVYTLSLFLLTSYFFHFVFSFYNQVWFVREEEHCGGEEETERRPLAPTSPVLDQFELTLQPALPLGRLETSKAAKPGHIYFNLIKSQNYYALKQDASPFSTAKANTTNTSIIALLMQFISSSSSLNLIKTAHWKSQR